MRVEIQYFSATGVTHRIAAEFARGLGLDTRFVNITQPETREKDTRCDADLEVYVVPVHGERIPGIIYRYLRRMNGNGRPLVVLAVYGNMDIGISLGQFDRLARDCNFRLIAAGAFVGEHSFCHFGSLQQAQGTAPAQDQGSENPVFSGNHVGMGRPDQADLMEIYRFGQRVREKLEKGPAEHIAVPNPKLPMFIARFPERGTRFIVRRPDADPQVCRQCGSCAKKCPVGAIDVKNFNIDESKCIRCMACVWNCPVSARTSGFKLKTFDRVFGYLGRKPKPNIIIY